MICRVFQLCSHRKSNKGTLIQNEVAQYILCHSHSKRRQLNRLLCLRPLTLTCKRILQISNVTRNTRRLGLFSALGFVCLLVVSIDVVFPSDVDFVILHGYAAVMDTVVKESLTYLRKCVWGYLEVDVFVHS